MCGLATSPTPTRNLVHTLISTHSGSNVTFSCDQIPTLSSVAPDVDSSLPANIIRLNIPSSILPTTQPSIVIVANMSFKGVNGEASVVVPLDHPPTCGFDPSNSSTCISVSLAPGKDTFPLAVAVIRVQGITDDYDSQLRYEFGFGTPIDGTVQQVGTSTSASVVGLRNGTVQVYGCAIDSIGGRTCGTGLVTVMPPSDSFNATDDLAAVDVDYILSVSFPGRQVGSPCGNGSC